MKHFDFFEFARHENGRFITKVDYIDDYTRIEGLSARGTTESSASWLLKKVITTGNIETIEYADDAQFTRSWTDRLLAFAPGSGSPTSPTSYSIPAVRVFSSDGTVFSPTGGGSTGLYTPVPINNTTWTALPATPREFRVSLNIQNNTGQEIKINHATPAGYEGMLVQDQQERIYTLFPKTTADATHIVYAKSSIGAVTLDVEEISQ